MRKLFTIILIILMAFPVFGANNPTNDKKTTEQKISGYIDDITQLVVGSYYYNDNDEGKGINLDYTDANNSVNRFLITPTSERLTLPGLPIGTFSLLATFFGAQRGARLTITHDCLVNSIDPLIQYDYELGIKYSLNDGITISDIPAKMCLSANSALTTISNQKQVVIDLPNNSGVISIQDAYIYFRLTSGNEVTVSGQYYSTVTFTLEVI